MEMLAQVLVFVFVFVVLEVTALFAPHELPWIGFCLAIFLFVYSKLDRIEIALSEERRAQYQRFQEHRREVVLATVMLTLVLCVVIYVLHMNEVIVPIQKPGYSPPMSSSPLVTGSWRRGREGNKPLSGDPTTPPETIAPGPAIPEGPPPEEPDDTPR